MNNFVPNLFIIFLEEIARDVRAILLLQSAGQPFISVIEGHLYTIDTFGRVPRKVYLSVGELGTVDMMLPSSSMSKIFEQDAFCAYVVACAHTLGAGPEWRDFC